jgi:16S rRNA processing protein RimM
MLVTIGRVGRPHGIRGEVTIEVRTDEPERYFLDDHSIDVDGKSMVITRAHWHGQRMLLSFAGIDDRTAAEQLRGAILTAERPDDQQPEDPDNFYDASLIGSRVERENGDLVGELSEIVHLPAQDLLVVTNEHGREFLVPFVTEIVPVVDVDQKRIVIDPPPGLLE